MTTKHTPGPWKARGHEIRMADNGSGNDHLIATVMPESSYAGGDARLIAAAPDLLEALEALRDDLQSLDLWGFYDTDRCQGLGGAQTLLVAAIAKARGESA